jgi:hypothetical protein
LCVLFATENTDPFPTYLYGWRSVLNHMAQGENSQFSNTMNVLSCSNPQRDILASSHGQLLLVFNNNLNALQPHLC